MINYTDEQLQVLHKWTMWGTDSFVTKRGSGWIVTIAGYTTPFVFKTRKAARLSADAQVHAFTTQQSDDPTDYISVEACRVNNI